MDNKSRLIMYLKNYLVNHSLCTFKNSFYKIFEISNPKNCRTLKIEISYITEELGYRIDCSVYAEDWSLVDSYAFYSEDHNFLEQIQNFSKTKFGVGVLDTFRVEGFPNRVMLEKFVPVPENIDNARLFNIWIIENLLI